MERADQHLDILTKKFERALLRVREVEAENEKLRGEAAQLQVELKRQLQMHQEDLQRARLQLEGQAREKDTAEVALRRANVPELQQRLVRAEDDLKLTLAKYQEVLEGQTRLQGEAEQYRQIIRQQEKELVDAKTRLSFFEDHINKLEKVRKKTSESYLQAKEQSALLAGELLEAQHALDSRRSEEDRKDSRSKLQESDLKSALRSKRLLESQVQSLESQVQKLTQDSVSQKEKLQVYRQRHGQLEKQLKAAQDLNERLKWENEGMGEKVGKLEAAVSGQLGASEVVLDQKLHESEEKIVKLSEKIGPLIELNERLEANLKDKSEEIRRLREVNKALNQTLLSRSKELALLESSGTETFPREDTTKGVMPRRDEMDSGDVFNTAEYLVSRKAKYLASPFHIESPTGLSKLTPERLDLERVYRGEREKE